MARGRRGQAQSRNLHMRTLHRVTLSADIPATCYACGVVGVLTKPEDWGLILMLGLLASMVFGVLTLVRTLTLAILAGLARLAVAVPVSLVLYALTQDAPAALWLTGASAAYIAYTTCPAGEGHSGGWTL